MYEGHARALSCQVAPRSPSGRGVGVWWMVEARLEKDGKGNVRVIHEPEAYEKALITGR